MTSAAISGTLSYGEALCAPVVLLERTPLSKKCTCYRGDVCRNCELALAAENGTSPRRLSVQPLTDSQRFRLTQYGVTEAELWNLLKSQASQCAVCALKVASPWDLVIDHNHETGKVRGLLCLSCNTGLGMLKDNPDHLRRALAYLEKNGNYASMRRPAPVHHATPDVEAEPDEADDHPTGHCHTRSILCRRDQLVVGASPA